jgi:hypothetical protein
MKKVRVTGIQVPAPSMRFFTTFLKFSKIISSLKAQVFNIFKKYLGNQNFLLHNKPF